MKLLIPVLVLMLYPYFSSAQKYGDKVELRNFIISNTPKTTDDSNSKKEEIYAIQGRRVGWSNLVGFGYIYANEIAPEYGTNTFVEFTADTNAAVRTMGILCLAKLKYDFEVLTGDETPVYMTHGDCRGGEVVTLEYLSRELKTNHHCQFYYGVISSDEHLLQCAIDEAQIYITEQNLNHIFDTNQVVDAKASIKVDQHMDIDKLHWDIYFLKKKGMGKPQLGLVRVYNGKKETELITLK